MVHDKQSVANLRVGTGLPGPGRPKGSPNRATADVRAAIALIVERNIENLEQWLQRVAADDPARAAELFLRTLEYHVPKLSRAEVIGYDDNSNRPIAERIASNPEAVARIKAWIAGTAGPAIESQRAPVSAAPGTEEAIGASVERLPGAH